MRRYNSKIPTEYNLKNVTIPVALFYGEADLLVSKEVNLNGIDTYHKLLIELTKNCLQPGQIIINKLFPYNDRIRK